MSSVLAVSTKRSAKQFARGQRGGIFTVSIPAPARTASNDAVNWPARSRTRNRKRGGAVVEVHQQVAGLLGGPGSGRVAGRPEDVHVAAADFQGEEHVDPFQGDGAVDVEEVHGQHGRGLRAQEPSPGRVGGSQRCRRYPPPLEDPADRGCADAVAELEQFALDALVAPGRVLAGQPFDQRGDRVVDGWATGTVRVGPLLGHQAAVPPQDRGRGDQAMTAQHRGRRRISAANTARSAQSRRGLGLVLRSTATSWRRTSSSMSLDDDARPSSVSQLRSRIEDQVEQAQRHVRDHACRWSSIAAGHGLRPTSGTPHAAASALVALTVTCMLAAAAVHTRASASSSTPEHRHTPRQQLDSRYWVSIGPSAPSPDDRYLRPAQTVTPRSSGSLRNRSLINNQRMGL